MDVLHQLISELFNVEQVENILLVFSLTHDTENLQLINPSINQLLFIEHIELVDGRVQLDCVQLEVFQWVESAVADVEHT